RGGPERVALRRPGEPADDARRDRRPAVRRPRVGRQHDDREAHPPPAGRGGWPPRGHRVDRRRGQGPARQVPGRGRHPADPAHRRGIAEVARKLTPTAADGLGTPTRPLRVAIVRAGPTGYYTASHLLRQTAFVV